MCLPKPHLNFFSQFLSHAKHLFGFTIRHGSGNFIVADISIFAEFIEFVDKFRVGADSVRQTSDFFPMLADDAQPRAFPRTRG